ncbi:PTS sugar transporter, partial [Salmonella enterica subsp. enterica serovar Meleagridis]|nr:PTS sugar transporter [Salmonella enterica subsp. enterica serovar Meleagridis]
VAPYFFLGFVVMAYLKITLRGIANHGAIVAVVMVNMPKFAASQPAPAQGASHDDEDDF